MEASRTLDQPDVRAQLHAMWDGVAPAWGHHADFIDERGLEITAALLAGTEPAPGERVLELAAGPGSVGLAAAPLVGAEGEVMISDVSPQMTAMAAERAAARELPNVRAEVLDLERIAVPDASFDVVLCREGLMLVPDPAAAAREIRRVLRPGGRFALSVWGPRERNPWLGVIFDTLTAASGTPVPPPGIPGPFSLDDAGRLEAVLTGAGLANVVVSELLTPYRAASVPEWWGRSAALAGPMAKRLAALPAFAREALMAKGGEAVARYATADGLDIPGVSLLASGRRP